MKRYDAVVIIDGVYCGWVGYFMGESQQAGLLFVRLFSFSSDGESYDVDIVKEYVLNVEPV